MIVEITIYPTFNSEGSNMYNAVYIHQQIVGNKNYIDSNIIIKDTRRPDGTYNTVIDIDPNHLDEHTPNIAIDWDGIDHIEIEVIEPDIPDRIVMISSSIMYYYDEYPVPVSENYDFHIDYIDSNKIDLKGSNVPHMVFNIIDWFRESHTEHQA